MVGQYYELDNLGKMKSKELAEDTRMEKLLEAEQEYEDGTDSKIK